MGGSRREGAAAPAPSSAALDRLPWRPCVGVTLINPRGLIFAGQRIDSEVPAWQMPQGGVDRGEAPEAAALRELKEEIGVGADRVEMLDATPDWLRYDLPPEIVPRIWGGRFRGQKQRWFLMRYLGRDDEITLETEHPEFSAWRWIDAETMLAGIVSFKRPIYDKVIARFRPWLA